MYYHANELIHEYKDYAIRRVIKHYAQGNEVFYVIIGFDIIFWTLKEAKAYIDKICSKKDN
jgi:hypothetical protein